MALHFEGLRKKVIKNYFTIIIITVTLFEGLFLAYIQNYYYDIIKHTLKSQINLTNMSMNTTTMEPVSFEDKINNILSQGSFPTNSKFAIQIIDKNRNVIIDQYGFKTKEKVNYEDVYRALKDSKNIAPHTYRLPENNEHVMSISTPIKVNNIIEGVVRYTVSLEKVDTAILKLSLALILAGVFILLIAISISLRFAETLIQPLRELKQFANELAHGNYSVKLKNRNISDDEIGDFAQTFEYMAGEIDKSRKLKEEFISSISHELRTPLTSIKGWSETLGYEGITTDELDLGLGIIQDETERLIKLVEELLDFSRLSSDRIKIQVDMVNIEELAKGVVNQLKVKTNEKNITLSYKFQSDEIKCIQGDKNRLRQVLINLVQNSIKFTHDGGFITVNVSQDDEFTTICVEDDGLGIEKENLDKVLDKFFQEDYNKAGSGLGLAISSEIVKLHSGEMKLESEKNVGTKITFTLKNKLIESI
ncbi:sensor histidine kinase [Romboutsia weinsteinii]|uniref:histidine kinase n=1 Tax=Romboutsia weinsteinii TaxID=2020949 RepID=A0A371J6T4_9FIRM|nr:HAMP domain-containing sensor histidine kinase [Romboutsia weinsteinii]RDY28376.1 sensor histidine kinase [Romboutsia weinsteinii]